MTRQASVILDNPVTLPAPGASKAQAKRIEAQAPRLVSKSNAAAIERKAINGFLKSAQKTRKGLVAAHRRVIIDHNKEVKKLTAAHNAVVKAHSKDLAKIDKEIKSYQTALEKVV